MEQLSLDLEAIETLQYPDLYRGHSLKAVKAPGVYNDPLGSYKAETWRCMAYGEKLDGIIITQDWYRAEEAIAAGMQYLDISIGKVKSKRRFAEYYDAALERVKARLAQSDEGQLSG